MSLNATQKASTAKIFKIRGTLIAVDLGGQMITIQPSGHDWKKIRRLSVRPESKVLAGSEQKTLADVVVGDWVHASFTREGGQGILTILHVPRSLLSSHAPRSGTAAAPSQFANGDPTDVVS